MRKVTLAQVPSLTVCFSWTKTDCNQYLPDVSLPTILNTYVHGTVFGDNLPKHLLIV